MGSFLTCLGQTTGNTFLQFPFSAHFPFLSFPLVSEVSLQRNWSSSCSTSGQADLHFTLHLLCQKGHARSLLDWLLPPPPSLPLPTPPFLRSNLCGVQSTHFWVHRWMFWYAGQRTFFFCLWMSTLL